MPLIGVDELMDDPDFVSDTLRVVRAKTVVNLQGMVEYIQGGPSPFLGIVHPVGARELERLPEGMNTTGAVVVITAFRLTAGDPVRGIEADEVRWKGDKYLVRQVDDFSEYGMGFVSAVCEKQTLNT